MKTIMLNVKYNKIGGCLKASNFIFGFDLNIALCDQNSLHLEQLFTFSNNT